MDLYEKRLRQEQRRAWIEGFVINEVLLYYLLVALLYLGLRAAGIEMGEWASTRTVVLTFIPASHARATLTLTSDDPRLAGGRPQVVELTATTP